MWDNVEDAFKDMDRKMDVAEYSLIARLLSSYRESLMQQGFTRREAMRLVESYSKFIYDLVIEDMLSSSSKSNKDDIEDDEDELD